jgi:hypothetical protein
MHASIGESDADHHVLRSAAAHLDQHCRKIDQAGTLNKLKK